jgi:hypothetical protein
MGVPLSWADQRQFAGSTESLRLAVSTTIGLDAGWG